MTKPLFTATVSADGGREGKVTSSDGVLNLDVAMPGTPRAKSSNKPQTLNSCLPQDIQPALTALFNSVARKERLSIETEVTAHVSLLKDESDQGYNSASPLRSKLPALRNRSLKPLSKKRTVSARIQKRQREILK